MEIKAVKFRKDGFYSQPFAFGGEESRMRTALHLPARTSARIWRHLLLLDISLNR